MGDSSLKDDIIIHPNDASALVLAIGLIFINSTSTWQSWKRADSVVNDSVGGLTGHLRSLKSSDLSRGISTECWNSAPSGPDGQEQEEGELDWNDGWPHPIQTWLRSCL